MGQTRLETEDFHLPPWLWDPCMTWSKKKRLHQHNKNKTNEKNDVHSRDFIDDVVQHHNDYRRKHQVPPLKHSPELTSQAQRWADFLATTNAFKHSNASLKGEKLGENIAMKWSSQPRDQFSGQDVTDQWYSEIKLHKFGQEPTNLQSGHFTQLIWKGSREIGIGRSRGRDGKIIVVANYRPAGNVVGKFTENVPEPKGVSKAREETTTKSYTQRQFGGRSSPTTYSINKSAMDRFKGGGSESRSTRTFTETTGSGANKVTKTIVEETIIKADGSKVTNRKETVTHGSSSSGDTASGFGMISDRGREKEKDKSEKSGAFGFFKSKDKKKGSSSDSDSSPERSKKPQNIKEFIDDAVKAHNTYRKKHKVAPLKHAKDLSAFAQKWAEHLAATNSFQHSDCMLKGVRLGENIACKWSSDGRDYTGQEVCDQWYSEIKKHDFGSEPRTTGTGHFTQMVWKTSEDVGIGKAKTSGGKVIVVASYRPAGNLVGSYKDNVNPPK